MTVNGRSESDAHAAGRPESDPNARAGRPEGDPRARAAFVRVRRASPATG